MANDSGTRENEPLLADDRQVEQPAQSTLDPGKVSPPHGLAKLRGSTGEPEADSELALGCPQGEDPSGWQGRAPPPGWTPVKSQDEASAEQAAGHSDGVSIQ